MFKKFEPKQQQQQLKSSQTRQLKEKIKKQLPLYELKETKTQILKVDMDLSLISMKIIQFRDLMIPNLLELYRDLKVLPRLQVDQGAIKFILKGADIMAPGITEVDPSLNQGQQVAVYAQGKQWPLAVGILNVEPHSLYSGTELKPKASRSGIAVLNVHYINDELYKHLIKDFEFY